uniref:Putative defensin-like protein 42 n=1 Tax=Arabidopsis thaliana TaxID=3702 RepID=DEF42_ARATH|nr:PUTATIVE PSEUDOGENE: RecName: Full=Putative defensin-like protein 42 [Arabidopsis thaliana]
MNWELCDDYPSKAPPETCNKVDGARRCRTSCNNEGYGGANCNLKGKVKVCECTILRVCLPHHKRPPHVPKPPK